MQEENQGRLEFGRMVVKKRRSRKLSPLHCPCFKLTNTTLATAGHMVQGNILDLLAGTTF